MNPAATLMTSHNTTGDRHVALFGTAAVEAACVQEGVLSVRWAFSTAICFALENNNNICWHAFFPKSSCMHVTNDIPLGFSLLLPGGTVNSVQTLKVRVPPHPHGATTLCVQTVKVTHPNPTAPLKEENVEHNQSGVDVELNDRLVVGVEHNQSGVAAAMSIVHTTSPTNTISEGGVRRATSAPVRFNFLPPSVPCSLFVDVSSFFLSQSVCRPLCLLMSAVSSFHNRCAALSVC
jgi:hypothetical protein